MKFGSVRPIVWPTPEFATSPVEVLIGARTYRVAAGELRPA